MPRVIALAALAALAALVLHVTTFTQGAPRAVGPADSCATEHARALSAATAGNTPGVRGIRRDVERAFTLFRLHRTNDATAMVDHARRRLERFPRSLSSEERGAFEPAVVAFRACVASASPAPLATLEVRTTAGAHVRIDDVPVGRASTSGTLTAAVPSGQVRVTALIPPGEFGEAAVRLQPGGRGAVTISLADGKELADETDLVLLEAADGRLRADTATLRLQFLQDDERPLAVTSIEEVITLDAAGGTATDLTGLFDVSAGAIVAADVRAVIERLSREPSPLKMRVLAADTEGFVRYNVVEFQLR